MSKSEPGRGWSGYTTVADPGGELPAEFARLFPPAPVSASETRPPGHAEQPPRSLIHPAPSKQGQARPAARPVKKPKKLAKPRVRKSQPGAQQFGTNKRAK
jgi:hypothetical protein